MIDSKPPVETSFEKLVAELKVKNIHFFHIDYNAPCLLPKILQNHCFQFLEGMTFVPRENLRRQIGNFFLGGGGRGGRGGWWGGYTAGCIVVFVKIVNSNFQPLVGGTCMVRVVVNVCGLINK